MTADLFLSLLALLVLGVAFGNLLGEFLFQLMNPEGDD